MKTNNKKLKNLSLEPLSLAKYFYEKGADDTAIIQRLIYLTYLEVLKKENALLFSESWQAWSGGPVVESVFYAMDKHLEKYGNCQKLFDKISPLNHQEIIKYCEDWAKCYQKCEKKRKEYKLDEQAQNQPWEIARSRVKNYLEHQKIELGDITRFVFSQ